jgi:two-component sensor histidine kinase
LRRSPRRAAPRGSSCRLAQRQRTAERERLLLRELHHRSSNLFVIVHAIVSRTLTGDLPIDEVREAL